MKTPSDLLIFVVGRSGSGKDTIMRNTVKALHEKRIPVRILQRMITREPDENEESLSISGDDFVKKREEGQFALSWHIYDNWYGIPRDKLEKHLAQGNIVLVNVSRNVLQEGKNLYPNCKIILIEVPLELAEKRVMSRGRESGTRLDVRITRMREKVDIPKPDKKIINAGNLSDAVRDLSNYLNTLYFENKSRSINQY